MSSSVQSSIKVAPSADGYVFLIEGRGTARESKSFHQLACACLQAAEHTLVFDLSKCEYLDSTFLGCLVDLHKRTNDTNSRCNLSATPEHCKTLLGYTQLDQILTVIDEPPAHKELVAIPGVDPDSEGFMQHMLECHRRLAEIDGPQQAIFASIAEKLADDLNRE